MKFNNFKNQKIFGIFQEEENFKDFEKYEIIFNFFLALEIIASIIKMKIYFIFQSRLLFSIVITNIIGIV